MKLVKCKKCGSTIMTSETLLSSMQEEYNELAKKAKTAKGADKPLYIQQMSHIKKMMIAVCHNISESESRKNVAYNEVKLLKNYIIENNLLDFETLDRIREEARSAAKRKSLEDEKKIDELYREFENHFYNRTKTDPTVNVALKGCE